MSKSKNQIVAYVSPEIKEKIKKISTGLNTSDSAVICTALKIGLDLNLFINHIDKNGKLEN